MLTLVGIGAAVILGALATMAAVAQAQTPAHAATPIIVTATSPGQHEVLATGSDLHARFQTAIRPPPAAIASRQYATRRDRTTSRIW